MENAELRKQAEEILSGLSEELKDAVYRCVWFDRVCEDIESLEETLELEMALTKDKICQVAERYVYNGAYDCDRSYWDNLKSLIYEVQL